MVQAYPAVTRGPDPFFGLRRVQDDMNRLLGAVPLAARAEFPPVNIWAGGEGAVVKAEIPGVNPEQIDVTVHQDTVTLRGKREPEALGDDTVVHRQERPHGSFARALVLPFRVDADRVSARFERGILTLELPRPAADQPRQVKIAHA